MQNVFGKKSDCSYCADAQSSHFLLYTNNLATHFFEPFLGFTANRTPDFLKKFAEHLLKILFQICIFLRVIRFSRDLEKVGTLRSKVIWQEARARGILMEQILLFGRPIEYFRAWINGKILYFESLPLNPEIEEFLVKNPWDSKFFLKTNMSVEGLPVPRFYKLNFWNKGKAKSIFNKLTKPIIVKPAVGSRGRHTTTDIKSEKDFLRALSVGFEISPNLIIEEHLQGYVCRATFVGGELVGFYRGEAPFVVGDGKKTIAELVESKNKDLPSRVSAVELSSEVVAYLSRFDFSVDDVLPKEKKVFLTHRTGRNFGGRTKEMLSKLHPSFIPALKKAAQKTNLEVLGFDCIIPNPESSEHSQRWGIIECNTLPFIDLHYFALEGKPEKNIAGMIWQLAENNLS